MAAGQNEQAQANQQARQTIMGGLQALGPSVSALGTAGGAQAQNALMRQVGVPSGLFGAARFLEEARRAFPSGTQGQPTNPFVSDSYAPTLDVFGTGRARNQAPT
jgi:hypothetical protein